MDEMHAQIGHERHPEPAHWEAKILWMVRDGARAFVTAKGAEPTEAVRCLYRHFQWMKREGWERTK